MWRLFTKSYWTYCVMGNFGSGKTSWTFLDISSYDKNQTYIIGNVPYSFVDEMYDTPDELNVILNSIINYCKITNRDIKKYHDERYKYKNIVLIVDEAHRYFDARKRKTYSDELDVVLSQCRKRNIQVFFISQRLKRVDLNIRRLSDFTVRYWRYKKPILPKSEFVQRFIYSNEWDLADIQWDEAKTYIMNWEQQKSEIEDSLIDSGSFKPLTVLFGKKIFNSQRGLLANEYYNTLYICGLDMKFVNASDPFLDKIKVDPKFRNIPDSKSNIEKIIPTFYSLYKNLYEKRINRSYSISWKSEWASIWNSKRIIKPRNWFFLSESWRVINSWINRSNLSNNNWWWSSWLKV